MKVSTICSRCGGGGWIKDRFLFFHYKKKCAACAGQGKVVKNIYNK